MIPALNIDDFVQLAPVIFVALWACFVLLASVLGAGKSRQLGALAAMGLVFGALLCIWSWRTHDIAAVQLFAGMVVIDRFALFIDVLVLAIALLTVLISNAYLEEHGFTDEAFYPLLILAVSGMMMMVHAASFVLLVIGLETMSLAVYALVASWVGKRTSAEAGIKYFLMGAVASAFLLYGIALLYGATGETNLTALARKVDGLAGNPLMVLGMFMVLGALAFKVALVPFHMWAPDAYEGAPTPITGFMAAAVKVAGFGALLRVMRSVFDASALTFGSTGWWHIFWVLSALTMTVANVAALRQHNIKRMLAYSSISHAGYLLIGVMATGYAPSELAPVLYYLLAYSLTTVGAFGVVAWLGSRDAERVSLDEWAGLARHHPLAALTMTLFLLSLAGIPPTVGFFAKFYLFRSALEHPRMVGLVVIAAINSIVSLYYYLKPVVAMYFRDGATAPEPLVSSSVTIALGISAVLVLLLGLVPGPSLGWAIASLAAP